MFKLITVTVILVIVIAAAAVVVIAEFLIGLISCLTATTTIISWWSNTIIKQSVKSGESWELQTSECNGVIESKWGDIKHEFSFLQPNNIGACWDWPLVVGGVHFLISSNVIALIFPEYQEYYLITDATINAETDSLELVLINVQSNPELNSITSRKQFSIISEFKHEYASPSLHWIVLSIINGNNWNSHVTPN